MPDSTPPRWSPTGERVDIPYEELPADSLLGFVRAMIPDIIQLDNPLDPTEAPSYLFSDGTLERFLAMNSGSARRAAAEACLALAGNENLILKKVTTEDLATDGPAVAKEHRMRAADLRDVADREDRAKDPGIGIFTTPLYSRPRFDAERIMHRGYFGF